MGKRSNLAVAGNVYNPGFAPGPKAIVFKKVTLVSILVIYILYLTRAITSMIKRDVFVNENVEALTKAASNDAESFTLTGLKGSLFMGPGENLIWLAVSLLVLIILLSPLGLKMFNRSARNMFALGVSWTILFTGLIGVDFTPTYDLRNVVYGAIDFEISSQTEETIIGLVNGKSIVIEIPSESLTLQLTPEMKEAIAFTTEEREAASK